MNKRPDFSGDLLDVRRDADENANTILSVVKARSAGQVYNAASQALPGETHLKPQPERAPRPASPRKPPRTQEQPSDRELVQLSTRITRATKKQLEKSALRQDLADLTPDTEQGIVEEALQQWFKRKGYGPAEVEAQDSPENEPTSSE